MDDGIDEQMPKRGTALLIASMVFVAFTFAFFIAPRAFAPPELTVRVAVIDSGISPSDRVRPHIISEASFINGSYGYDETDNSTLDSEPRGSKHGTYVTNIIVEHAPNAAIINAKVVNSGDIATTSAVIAAIRWAVTSQDCDIINLSIGTTPTDNDGIEEIIMWAFEQGVSIIAAAGNNGQNGITGSSVESPGVYKEVIAVSAIDGNDNPYPFSGYGPSLGRVLKPDISAPGYYSENSITLVGTSYAAPIVTAAAVNLIQFCINNNWKWTPGMIKATLLASASYLSSNTWQVGAGAIDVDLAKGYLESAKKVDNLPLMAWMAPEQGIFEFERWFVNTTNRIKLQIFTSTNASFTVRIAGVAAPWVSGPDLITLNQSGEAEYEIRVSSGISWEDIEAKFLLISEHYRIISTSLRFDATPYVRKIGFDFTHTPWWMDSIFGQFRSFYTQLTSIGIAVEEIRSLDNLNYEYLRQFDAIVVLDPGAWEFEEINETLVPEKSIEYTEPQLEAYSTYWEKGGNLFISGGANNSLDIENANRLLSIFNASFNYDKVPEASYVIDGVANSIQIRNIRPHTITVGVESFDYNGASISVENQSYAMAYENIIWVDEEGITHTALRPVLVAMEGRLSSRVIITGTNFFLDNWGINGKYGSQDDWVLLRRCIYWITGIF